MVVCSLLSSSTLDGDLSITVQINKIILQIIKYILQQEHTLLIYIFKNIINHI